MTGSDSSVTRNRIDGRIDGSTVIQARSIDTVHVHTTAPQQPPVPRQLRPQSSLFTDRVEELADLTGWFARQPWDAVAIAVITGKDGVGKSAFANRLLHLLAAQFPGGQVAVDLRSASPGPATRTGDALGMLLRAVGSGYLPAREDEQSACWRSITAADPDRPMAMLLDDPHDDTQVRTLLPGGFGHLVVVTSRAPLPGLLMDGARTIELGPLPAEAARELLSRCVGPQRIAREPEAARRLAALSGGSPLALAVTATHLATTPDQSLAQMTNQLSAVPIGTAEPGTRTPQLILGEPVTPALDAAYRSLTPAAAQVYRRLALLPVPDLDTDLAAAACAITTADADRYLHQLLDAGLLERRSQQPQRGLILAYHDAVRAHALLRAAQEEPAASDAEVLRRTSDWLLFTATVAERLITPTHRRCSRDYEFQPPAVVDFDSQDAALAWLDENHAAMMATVRATAAAGMHAPTAQLPHAWWPWWHRHAELATWIEAHTLALAAARQLQDPLLEREIANTLGIGERMAHNWDRAVELFTTVLDLARADGLSEAQALHELGTTLQEAGRPEEAEPQLLLARDLRVHLGYPRGVALTEISLGLLARSLGYHDRARGLLSSAHGTLEREGDVFDAARALAWLGRTHAALGDYTTAEQLQQQAHETFLHTGSPRWTGRSLELRGDTAWDQQNRTAAADFYDQAIAIYATASPRDAERLQRERPV